MCPIYGNYIAFVVVKGLHLEMVLGKFTIYEKVSSVSARL